MEIWRERIKQQTIKSMSHKQVRPAVHTSEAWHRIKTLQEHISTVVPTLLFTKSLMSEKEEKEFKNMKYGSRRRKRTFSCCRLIYKMWSTQKKHVIILTRVQSYLCHVRHSNMWQKLNLVNSHSLLVHLLVWSTMSTHTHTHSHTHEYIWTQTCTHTLNETVISKHSNLTVRHTDLSHCVTLSPLGSTNASLPVCLSLLWHVAADWRYMELFIVSHPRVPACCPLLRPGPREGADRGGRGSGFQAKLNPAASWAQQRLSDLR